MTGIFLRICKLYCHELFNLMLLYCKSCRTNTSRCVTAKPIDLLARYISAEDDDLAVEMHEPYTYLNVRMYTACLTETQHFNAADSCYYLF